MAEPPDKDAEIAQNTLESTLPVIGNELVNHKRIFPVEDEGILSASPRRFKDVKMMVTKNGRPTAMISSSQIQHRQHDQYANMIVSMEDAQFAIEASLELQSFYEQKTG